MPAPATAGEMAGACRSPEFNVLIHHSFLSVEVFLYSISYMLLLLLNKYDFKKYVGMCLNIFKRNCAKEPDFTAHAKKMAND